MKMSEVFNLPVMSTDQVVYDLRDGMFVGQPCKENNFFMGVMNTKQDDEGRAKAAKSIAHAINMHDELVEALEELSAIVQGVFEDGDLIDSFTLQTANRVLDKAKAS